MTDVDRVPAFHELMAPALQGLTKKGGSASNEELLSAVIEVGQISDTTASLMHTDNRQTKLAYNLAWAKSYLKKAGAISNSQRGIWSITELGERMSSDDIAKIPADVRKTTYEASKQVRLSSDPIEEVEASRSSWRDQLLNTLKGMNPSAFERLAQRVLRESGFVKVEVTGRANDGGIDGVGVLRLNLLSFIVLFQCKRYDRTVSPNVVRDFRGAMVGRSDKGLIITTATFSAEAKREATRDGAPAIDLIDGDQLCDLLQKLGLGVRTEVVEQITIDRDWFAEV